MAKETDKEKADNLMLDIDNLTKNSGFSSYLFFCVADNEAGGFASANMEGRGEELITAQIIDTLRNNKDLYAFLKNAIDKV